jgi:hypothetical protein
LGDVVDTLEQRWNNTLETVERIRVELDASQVHVQSISQDERGAILKLGQRINRKAMLTSSKKKICL